MTAETTRVGVVAGDGAVLRRGDTVVLLGSPTDEIVAEAASLLATDAREERIRALAGMFLRRTLDAAAVIDFFPGGADAFAVGAIDVVVSGRAQSAAGSIMGLSGRYTADDLEAIVLAGTPGATVPGWVSFDGGAVPGAGIVVAGAAPAPAPSGAGAQPAAEAPAAGTDVAPEQATSPGPPIPAPQVDVAPEPEPEPEPPAAAAPAPEPQPAPAPAPPEPAQPVADAPPSPAPGAAPPPPSPLAAPPPPPFADASPPPPPPAAAPPPPAADAPPPPPPPAAAPPPPPAAAAAPAPPPPPPPVAAPPPPPPPAAGAAPPPPPAAGPGGDGPVPADRYQLISLTASVDLSDRTPIPEMPPAPESAADAPSVTPTDDMPPYAQPVKVLGVLSPRGFFNHPEARFCSRTGVKMGASETKVLVQGDRPPLGVLTFDDGSTYSMQWTTVAGRDPRIDDQVASGQAAPLTLTDDELKISRRHILLELRDWDVLISDLDTANGTYIREAPGQTPRRLAAGEKVVISNGAEVFLGDRSFTYHEHHVR